MDSQQLLSYTLLKCATSSEGLQMKKGPGTFESISPFAKEMDSKTIERAHKKGLITTSNERKQALKTKKIKREKLIRASVLLKRLQKKKRKWTREDRRKEGGWCRHEGVTASRCCFSWLSGGWISRESVGYGCGGVVAGRCWQTGQNMAFFCCWLKEV